MENVRVDKNDFSDHDFFFHYPTTFRVISQKRIDEEIVRATSSAVKFQSNHTRNQY
jgi:hypothetical protein